MLFSTRCIVPLAVFLLLSGGAGATEPGGALATAEAAHARGDYETALTLFLPLAERGDAGARVALGGMYLNGDGVATDSAAARGWFRRAARQNSPDAIFHLAEFRRTGRGVPFDTGYAVLLYRKAARLGHAGAAYRLGVMYENGTGTPADLARAAARYGRAAAAGVADARERRDALAERLPPAPRRGTRGRYRPSDDLN